MPARRLLALLAVTVAATGCTASEGARKVEPPVAAAADPAAAGAGATVREGRFGGADGLHARVRIKGIERHGAQTLVRYTVTSMETTAKSAPFSVTLLDPVDRVLYRPIAASPAPGGSASPTTANAAYAAPTPTATTPSPSTTPSTSPGGTPGGAPSGSPPPATVPAPPQQFAPGATRELAAAFPPVPATVRGLTVLLNGTAGEFTGVPVTGTASAPATAARPGNPVDLYDITEGATRDVAAGPSDVKVALRGGALFKDGTAELSGGAKALLDRTGQEIRQKADPGKGPILITGHTGDHTGGRSGGQGSDAGDVKLSEERAEAVQKELKSRLGGSYTYTVQGRGGAEPVAGEAGGEAQARARNERVEIAYVVRRAPDATPSAGAAGPAGFRARDGATVASRTAKFGEDRRRIDVKPFYRDGAYLVAVFDIVNEGPGTTPPEAVYPHKDYLGGAFTSFSVQVPGGTDVYRAVRIGPPAANSAMYVDPGRATFSTAVKQPARGFVYLPAPPGSVKKVIFNAGPFGKVNDVPIS